MSSFNLLSANKDEVYARMIDYCRRLFLLKNLVASKRPENKYKAKEEYRKLKTEIQNEYKAYCTAKFQNAIIALEKKEKYKTGYMEGIKEAVAKGFQSRIGGTIQNGDLWYTEVILSESMLHFEDFKELYEKMSDTIKKETAK